MNFLTSLSRILVGALFIFSGMIKLNDPLGFSYKLNDYFAPDVLNLAFLQDFALPLALFIVILEVLLGVALLIGFWPRLTSWLLLLMIVFFTFLTFYSAYFNKVTDCGCFGDAIPLTPWQSFGKDVVLTVFIVIVFINRNRIKPLFAKIPQYTVMAVALLTCVLLGNHVLNHLPLRDFRPYAEGRSIVEGMKSAEELGLKPTTYLTIYHLKHRETGEIVEVDSEAYVAEKWYQKKEWEIQPELTESRIKEKGYEPPIHDFVLSLENRDITSEVLEQPAVFLVISYKLEKADAAAFERINAFAEAARQAQIPVIGLTASLPKVKEARAEKWNITFPFATADETALKTIVRSNPGIVLLKRGTVARKWHHQDLPAFSSLLENEI